MKSRALLMLMILGALSLVQVQAYAGDGCCALKGASTETVSAEAEESTVEQHHAH
ncbi:MAG: hypothetical protein HY592_00375 [Candidatus Omnitrophica bacterium]|nr:hypothetical protein [Candidatus Omnitrophota bacterium]